MTMAPAAYCAHCGQPVGGQPAESRDHAACEQAGALDPPRYCARCGRRMIVKVTPDRWTARCSTHGESKPGPSPGAGLTR
jgi:DNA-directed RNA polymerase subunit RPC12/RpoP